ncbi:MAG: hypothetical protein GY874_02705 [Desulfobacteraceae bacterium]|nr:hypothetical protein [Desulfobacteraceae bacterium]
MSTTPNPVDSFSRYQADLFDERRIISVPTGFQAFFGNPGSGAFTHFSPDANVVDIDIVRGDKKTAALIPRGMVSRPLGSTQKDLASGKFSSFSRKYPLSEEEGNISANDVLYRMPGESVQSGRTRLDRMRERARDLHAENVRRHVRLFEVLASESILTGKQPAIVDTKNDDLIYDFLRNPDHTVTVSIAWNGTKANIFGDIDAACEKLEANGNVVPNFIGLGGLAMEALIKDADAQQLADNRRFELIRVSNNNPVPPEFARFTASGWIARGLLHTPKGHNLWLFTYYRTYTDSNGKPQKYMPDDQAFICSVGARCDRYFGPPETLPMTGARVRFYQELFGMNPTAAPMPPNIANAGAVVSPAMFYCDAYAAADQKSVTIRTQSAPIFATTQTDAFVTLKGLIGNSAKRNG